MLMIILGPLLDAVEAGREDDLAAYTPNLPTNIVDCRGLDSSIILI